MNVHDSTTARQLFAGPGSDTRQWCSFGTVDPETADQKSVTFTTQYGPLVNVTLRPSAIPVVCRVAHEVAGNGEGEWFPFVGGDEVMVLIPEGDEQAGCTIVGRLNQEIDAWPQQVAGMDATKNNFAFRRMRVPYVLETASNYLLRDATTGAFLSMKAGTFTISNGDKAFLMLGSDFLGLQTADASTLLQLNVSSKQLLVQANGTQLLVDGSASTFLTKGTLALLTSGNKPIGHAITLESVVAILGAFAAASPGPVTGAALAAFLASALPTAAAFPLAPYQAGIAAALQIPVAPGTAGVGCPGLTLG